MTDTAPRHYDDFNEYDDDDCDICGRPNFNCACDECGRLPDGTCTLAGTEHCDFDCPFNPTDPTS